MTSPPVDLWTFAVTIPAGTQQATPFIANLTMPARKIVDIEAMVPSGWNGVAGFALGAAGQPVIPFGPNTWVVASGETLNWQFDNLITSGAWQCFGYNLGVNPHTVYLRFTAALVPDATSNVTATMLQVASLTPVPAIGQ